MRLPHLPRPGPPGIAAVVLAAAAVGANVAPLPGTACPSAAAALVQSGDVLPSESAPKLDADVSAADGTALATAQKALGRHAKAVDAAQKSLDAASALTGSASTAQQQVDAASSGSGQDVELESAKSTVAISSSAVQSAQGSLDDVLQQQRAAVGTSYDNPADYDSSVADARASLAAVQAQLGTDTKALQAIQAKADALASTQAAVSTRATTLSTRARKADATAVELLGQANTVETSLQDALTTARSTQQDHVSEQRSQLAAWSHHRRLKADSVRALNAELSACQDAGLRSGEVGGGLLLVGGLVVIASAVGRRRNS